MINYFDGNKILSHNCLFNLIIGNRGCGKTYWAKKRAIKNYLKNGAEFIYLRRYDSELQAVKETLFGDIIKNEEFPESEITYNQNNYYLDGNVIGYPIALSREHHYKSSSFPMCNFIIFDEFLIDEKSNQRYLKNEVNRLLNFYDTVDRKQGRVILFMLSNSLSFINPYTNFWNLRMPYNTDLIKKGEVLLKLEKNMEFIKQQKNTRFGKLIAGTEYEKYSVDNIFINDSETFIEKKSGGCTYRFSFIYLGEIYGVWVNWKSGLYFVSEDNEKSCNIIYSITMDDHQPNTLFLNGVHKSALFKPFINAYSLGYVRFENQKIKTVVTEVIKLTKNY